LLTFFQARNDSKSRIGNKGIIEQLSDKPLNVVFETDKLKRKILYSDKNPLTISYFVDV